VGGVQRKHAEEQGTKSGKKPPSASTQTKEEPPRSWKSQGTQLKTIKPSQVFLGRIHGLRAGGESHDRQLGQ